MKSEEIAKQIGCSGRTIRRELAKGRTTLMNTDLTTRIEYSADIGQQIIRKIKSKSQYCVVKELDKIERKMGSKKFRETFKTITCDNGL